MTKKAYTQPSLTTYGSVEKLTKANGTISFSDSFILTNLPGEQPDPITVDGQGSIDIEIDVEGQSLQCIKVNQSRTIAIEDNTIIFFNLIVLDGD